MSLLEVQDLHTLSLIHISRIELDEGGANMDKKHRFTLHVNMDDFIPATDEEKSYICLLYTSRCV